jgi:hypothetical protein
MRRRCGICAIESMYLTKDFVVVRCETSDHLSEHGWRLMVGALELTSGAEATMTASKSHICPSVNKYASAEAWSLMVIELLSVSIAGTLGR